VTAAGGILAEIARQMRELLPSVPELDEYCPMIGIAVPSPLRNASEDVLLNHGPAFSGLKEE
jgi:hypothetical protein